MDFVHAKCAFSLLLVLKLSILLQDDLHGIIVDAEELLHDLSRDQACRTIYFKIMELTVAKGRNALKELTSITTPTSVSLSASGNAASVISPAADSGMDLQTFVPNEFIFEWDFPGLTLFSTPLNFQTLFTEFAAGI